MESRCYLSIGLIFEDRWEGSLGDITDGKDIAGSTTHDSCLWDSGVGTCSSALSFLVISTTTYIQSIKSQVAVQGNDEGRTTNQLKPSSGGQRHSRQDPSPTSCQTKLYFERKARSDCQLTPSQFEGRRTISGYAREDPRGVGIGSVISLS